MAPAVAVVVALATVIGACGGSATEPGSEPEDRSSASATPAPGSAGTYVALGDSAASGMGIPPEEGTCRRSERAYGPLLAARHGYTLVNRTCAGARVGDVLGTSDVQGPPQIDGLDSDTALVTLMIGANDLGYAGLLAGRCAEDASGSGCDPAESQERVAVRLEAIGKELRVLLDAITTRAPQARVLVVGYADALGAGPCLAMPLTRAAFAAAAEAVVDLNGVLRSAADDAGAEFVDTYDATRGHGVCDDEPWVNNLITGGDGAPGHPRSAYHAAVADLLDGHLS